jgi:hypothetical protein
MRIHVGQEDFRVAGVEEDSTEDEPADQDDNATETEWAGLQHEITVAFWQ